jgi:uncharacterized protein
VTVSTSQSNLPDYGQLVKFLFQPFLSVADAISVDCEYTIDRQRVWIRVAIASTDRDTAFGRGGRNIQAIRTVLQAAASAVGQSVHLDVYGSNSGSRHLDSDRSRDDVANARVSPGVGAAPSEQRSGSRPVRSAPNRRTTDDGDRRSSGGDSPSVPPPRPRR